VNVINFLLFIQYGDALLWLITVLKNNIAA
jgi:hypothetical protein